jgi:hypothetical protein
VTRKKHISFELCFGGCIVEFITFIQMDFLTEDLCIAHYQPTLMVAAASSAEILVTVFQNKGDNLKSSVHPNRDNFKSRASFILCFMRCPRKTLSSVV